MLFHVCFVTLPWGGAGEGFSLVERRRGLLCLKTESRSHNYFVTFAIVESCKNTNACKQEYLTDAISYLGIMRFVG